MLGLTLGFAAFSNTLTISSSATVSPALSDFKMVMYGLTDEDDWKISIKEGAPYYTSATFSVPIIGGTDMTAPNAIIDNETLTIKNITPSFKEPGSTLWYSFKVVNEGKYTAYIDKEEVYTIKQTIDSEKQCIPAEGTTAEYVASACKDIDFVIEFNDTHSNSIASNTPAENVTSIAIEPNEYVELIIEITYWHSSTALRADGDFNIKFPDIKINFSTVKPEA